MREGGGVQRAERDREMQAERERREDREDRERMAQAMSGEGRVDGTFLEALRRMRVTHTESLAALQQMYRDDIGEVSPM